MKVLALNWLGMRTKQFAPMSALFAEALGLELQSQDSFSSRFCLENKTEVHVYNHQDEFHQFFGDAPVIGFEVDSFTEARAQLQAFGVEFIYPQPQRQAGRAWQHFRAPDGNVYEIMGVDDLEQTISDF
jgi:catechol 2,3-dioxygenase-like lactoylglutathione lyase family enzyme